MNATWTIVLRDYLPLYRFLSTLRGEGNQVHVVPAFETLHFVLASPRSRHVLTLGVSELSYLDGEGCPCRIGLSYQALFRALSRHKLVSHGSREVQLRIDLKNEIATQIAVGDQRAIKVLTSSEDPHSCSSTACASCKWSDTCPASNARMDGVLIPAYIEFRFPVYVRAIAHNLQRTKCPWVFFLIDKEKFRFISYGEESWFQVIYLKSRKRREDPLDIFYHTGKFHCYLPRGMVLPAVYDLDPLNKFLFLAENETVTRLLWDEDRNLLGIISIGDNPMYGQSSEAWRYKYSLLLDLMAEPNDWFQSLAGKEVQCVCGMTLGEEGLGLLGNDEEDCLDIEPFRPLLRFRTLAKLTVGGPGFDHPETGCWPDLSNAYRKEMRRLRKMRKEAEEQAEQNASPDKK